MGYRAKSLEPYPPGRDAVTHFLVNCCSVRPVIAYDWFDCDTSPNTLIDIVSGCVDGQTVLGRREEKR